MPTADQLPDDIRNLARCNYLRLGHRAGDPDVTTIIAHLREIVPHMVITPASDARPADSHQETAHAPDPVILGTTDSGSKLHNEVNGGTPAAVLQAGTIYGGVHVHSVTRRTTTPRQLPAAPASFIGRDNELAALTAVLDDQVRQGRGLKILAIGGTGGVGKTWLALHWAYKHLDRFPDGHLYVNLRGFGPSEEPMHPTAALRGFLDALSVHPSAIPVDPNSQVGLYRSLVADKRMLVVLDNVADSAHVTSLLPGAAACTVLITSRRRLTGLASAQSAYLLNLAMLSENDARAVLTRQVGERRLAAEPEAANELIDCCAGLPLGLSIVAARAAASPHFPLKTLADELRDASMRLNALDSGEDMASVRAALSWSSHALENEEATLFGLLGIAPGSDFSLAAVASLTALPTDRAGMFLRKLQNAYLLTEPTPTRYQMHDLVRLHAAERARLDIDSSDRQDALRRIVEFYLYTAIAADQLLDPNRQPLDTGSQPRNCQPMTVLDPAGALAWFDIEHQCLLAAQRISGEQGWHEIVWQFAWAMSTFHWRRGHLSDRRIVWQAALTSCDYRDDVNRRQLAHRLLGSTCARLGEHVEALEHLGQTLILAEQARDPLLEAHTHRSLARAWEEHHDYQSAREHAILACDIYHTLSTPAWEAGARNLIGWYQAKLGEYQSAQVHCADALQWYRSHDDRDGQATALESLGYLAHRTEKYAIAVDCYRQAVTFHRELGNITDQATTLESLGKAYAALGKVNHAQVAWKQAMAVYDSQCNAKSADRIRQHLVSLNQK
jgi:tetratricopeptide (TPR) repeat protein